MVQALHDRLNQLDGQILMITGVREGESIIRDRRIGMSCSKDGAECGQGWYQQVLPNAKGLRSAVDAAALTGLPRVGMAAPLGATGGIR